MGRRPMSFETPGPVELILAAAISPIEEIIEELETTKVPERAGRAMDHESEDAFERLRADGYL